MPEHHDRGTGLDRLRGDADAVRLVGEHLAVGIPVPVGAERPDLAAALRHRDPGRSVREQPVRVVDVRAAAVACHRGGAHSLREGAENRRDDRLALLPVGEHGAVRRQRVHARALGDDEVDAAGRP